MEGTVAGPRGISEETEDPLMGMFHTRLGEGVGGGEGGLGQAHWLGSRR